jgi:hypothetical protein
MRFLKMHVIRNKQFHCFITVDFKRNLCKERMSMLACTYIMLQNIGKLYQLVRYILRKWEVLKNGKYAYLKVTTCPH